MTRAQFEEWRGDRGPHDPEIDGWWEDQAAAYEAAWNEFHAVTHSLATFEQLPKGFIWDDPLHGRINLTEEHPLAAALVAQPTFRRLFEVQQFGDRRATSAQMRVKPHSRAEHSLGTYQLIRRHGGAEPLQIAGLLHDVGHTAFSHHGEIVFDAERTETWHETMVRGLITDPEHGIAPVLAEYGVDPEAVIQQLEHPLLDQSHPELCADRVDYIWRDAVACGFMDADLAAENLTHLRVTEDGRDWYFDHPQPAQLTRELLELLHTAVYTSNWMAEIKYLTGDLLRHGLDRGYLERKDILLGTDDGVLDKLWTVDAEDLRLDQLLREFRELGVGRLPPEMWEFQLDHIATKFRSYDHNMRAKYVDPLCEHVDAHGQTRIRRFTAWQAEGYDQWHEPLGDRVYFLPPPPQPFYNGGS